MTPLETYFEHVLLGKSLRQIARECNQHASTILRRIRRIEDLRDDTLVDYYLDGCFEEGNMLEQDVALEATALGHLCKKGAFVIAAPEMKDAIVMRQYKGEQVKLCTFPSSTVAEWVINGYLNQFAEGKVNRYEITEKGKAHTLEVNAAAGYLGRQAEQERASKLDSEHGQQRSDHQPTRKRYSTEPPLVIMYGKQTRKPNSRQWISERGFVAATRLAEDFAQSQMPGGTPASINWDNIGMKIDATPRNNCVPRSWFDRSSTTRFEDAVKAVGADLSDILVLFVCYEHGIEQVEKAMEWPARSGKAILGIALERLADHYVSMGDDIYRMVGKPYPPGSMPPVNK